MSERLIKQHYMLHTWCGIVLGLFLFLLCFSGALAVYKDDLSQWSERTAASRSGDCRIGVDAAFSSLRERAGSAEIRRLSLPQGGNGYYLLRLKDGSRIALDRCGEETSAGAALLADFFVNLHTRLFFGHEGRWLVGVAGLGMLASLVSGLLFYPKLWRAFFTQRWSRSLRLALSDLHKTVAVWALPFHLLITLTGIWLGLYGLIIPAAQFIRAPEAPPVKMKTAGRPAAPPPARETPPALGALLERAQTAVPGLQPLFVDFKEGMVEVRGNLPGHLVQRHRAGVDFEGGSGAPLMVHDPRRQALPGRLHDMMMPLHFGDWGGDMLKAVYLLLGIAGAALALSGVAVWAEKRVRHAGLFGGPALWPGRLLAGVGGGGAVAVLAMPLVAKVDAVAGFEGDLGIYFALLWGMFCAGLASSPPAAAWRRVVVLSLFVCVATVAAGLLVNRGFSGVEGGYAVAAVAALLARTRFALKGPRAAEVPRGAAV